MRKLKWVKFAGFAMLVLLSLFLCVGCSDEVKDNLVSVEFGCSGSGSRKIGTEITQSETIKPEDLYWTYTAEKKSGIYAYGASEKDGDGNLIELPVNSTLDSGKGLRGFVTKFSTGEWEFKFFGYGTRTPSGTGYTYSDKVYSGSTTVTLAAPTASADVAHVGFRLVLEKTYTKGKLEIGEISFLRIMLATGESNIPANSKLKLEIKEGTTSVASVEWVTAVALSNGSQTVVPKFTFSKSEFPASEKHTFDFCLYFDSTGGTTYKAAMWGSREIPFTAGCTTKIDDSFTEFFSMPIEPVGGSIFYVSNDNGSGTVAGTAWGTIKADGVEYAFFDSSKKRLGSLSGVAGNSTVASSATLAKAAYWCANGRTGYDVVYVVNLDLCPFTHENIGWTVRGVPTATEINNLTTYGFVEDRTAPKIGTGRKNTMAMYSCAIANKFTGQNTIWDWLSMINGCLNTSPNNTKYTDWYFGSVGESIKLAQSGQVKSGSNYIITSTPYGTSGYICGVDARPTGTIGGIVNLGSCDACTDTSSGNAYRMYTVIRSF